jgi:hypothetical protein
MQASALRTHSGPLDWTKVKYTSRKAHVEYDVNGSMTRPNGSNSPISKSHSTKKDSVCLIPMSHASTVKRIRPFNSCRPCPSQSARISRERVPAPLVSNSEQILISYASHICMPSWYHTQNYGTDSRLTFANARILWPNTWTIYESVQHKRYVQYPLMH